MKENLHIQLTTKFQISECNTILRPVQIIFQMLKQLLAINGLLSNLQNHTHKTIPYPTLAWIETSRAVQQILKQQKEQLIINGIGSQMNILNQRTLLFLISCNLVPLIKMFKILQRMLMQLRNPLVRNGLDGGTMMEHGIIE